MLRIDHLTKHCKGSDKGVTRQLRAQGGAIFSAHVLDAAEKLCNKAAIIKEGNLVAAGDMDRLMKPGTSLEDFFMEVAKGSSAD